MNEEIKEKLDLNPNNMNEIAKEVYYQLENYIFTLEKIQNNWNELKKWLEEYIEATENDYKQTSTEGCKKTQKTIIAILKNVLKQMQELEQGKDD